MSAANNNKKRLLIIGLAWSLCSAIGFSTPILVALGQDINPYQLVSRTATLEQTLALPAHLGRWRVKSSTTLPVESNQHGKILLLKLQKEPKNQEKHSIFALSLPATPRVNIKSPISNLLFTLMLRAPLAGDFSNIEVLEQNQQKALVLFQNKDKNRTNYHSVALSFPGKERAFSVIFSVSSERSLNENRGFLLDFAHKLYQANQQGKR